MDDEFRHVLVSVAEDCIGVFWESRCYRIFYRKKPALESEVNDCSGGFNDCLSFIASKLMNLIQVDYSSFQLAKDYPGIC